MEKKLAIIKQQIYAADHGLPLFAPSDGICPHCLRSIYAGRNGLSIRDASTFLITYCPHCNTSFCD